MYDICYDMDCCLVGPDYKKQVFLCTIYSQALHVQCTSNVKQHIAWANITSSIKPEVPIKQ